MRRIAGRVPTFVLAALLVPVSVTALHLHLTRSEPASDEALSKPPAQIRLWFSETPVVQLSTITLLTSDSTKIQLDAVKAVDDSSVSAAVKGATPPGQYTVVWRATSGDGHVVRGRYVFNIGVDSAAKPGTGSQ